MAYLQCASGTCTHRPRLNGAGVKGRIVFLRGLGQDPTLDPMDFPDPFTSPPMIALPTISEPVNISLIPPDIPEATITPGSPMPVILQPTFPNTPASAAGIYAGAVGTNSQGQYINSVGQVIAALGTVAGATGQILTAAQSGRPALTPAMIAAGAVGYNALGQPVNAMGLPVGAAVSAQLIPGLSNTTLMFIGIVAFAVLAMGSARR